MFPDIEKIRKDRKRYSGKLYMSGVDTFRQMAEVEAGALKSGALDAKTKELIALGVSMANNCYGWIEYHVSRAADLGAGRKEILEAAAVAVALCGSVADWPARFVAKVLEDIDAK